MDSSQAVLEAQEIVQAPVLMAVVAAAAAALTESPLLMELRQLHRKSAMVLLPGVSQKFDKVSKRSALFVEIAGNGEALSLGEGYKAAVVIEAVGTILALQGFGAVAMLRYVLSVLPPLSVLRKI